VRRERRRQACNRIASQKTGRIKDAQSTIQKNTISSIHDGMNSEELLTGADIPYLRGSRNPFGQELTVGVTQQSGARPWRNRRHTQHK
jgi:hypothetical protein